MTMSNRESRIQALKQALQERILILDGGMGTMIQGYNLEEADYRGERWADYHLDIKGNNDLLSITQPDIIQAIHTAYLEAGADILETNTFNATRVSQADYEMEDIARELNVEGARMARLAADAMTAKTPDKPRFVAGVLGPTSRTASLSPDVNDPAFRNITFDELVGYYRDATEGLVEGGVDIILIETVFDTLNAKAALVALREVYDEDGIELPVIVSAAVGRGGETMISAQKVEALWNAVAHVDPLAVGLNCSLGPDVMEPFIAAQFANRERIDMRLKTVK